MFLTRYVLRLGHPDRGYLFARSLVFARVLAKRVPDCRAFHRHAYCVVCSDRANFYRWWNHPYRTQGVSRADIGYSAGPGQAR